jgi:hypothetical protein
MEPVGHCGDAMSIATFFRLLYDEQKDAGLLAEALQWPFLSDKTRAMLSRWLRPLDPS